MKKSALIVGAVIFPAAALAQTAYDNQSPSAADMNNSTPPPSTSTGSFQSDTDTGQPSGLANAKQHTAEQFLLSDEDTKGPGYTYAHGEYIPQGKFHHATSKHDDFTGYGGGASLAFPLKLKVGNVPFFPIIQGAWHRLNVDHSSLGVNHSYVGLGGATFYDYGGAKNTGIGFYGTVNYERLQARLKTGGHNPHADGWGITTGLRWLITSQLELNPHATYHDYGHFSGSGASQMGSASPSGFDYGMRLVGYLDEGRHTALTLDYDHSDIGIVDNHYDEPRNIVSVGARFTF
jgi:hypothetical protein